MISLRKLLNCLSAGHERSVKIKKNIVLALLFKAPTILIDLLVVRLTIDYLEPMEYGVWATLASIIAWLSFSDFGLSSGLRNRVAESLAHNQHHQARVYISTTYAVMLGISLLTVVLFSTVNNFIDWNWVLNAPASLSDELKLLAFWVFFFTSFYSTIGIIKAILKATQVSSAVPAIDLSVSILSLIVVWILLETTSNSLLLLGFWRSFLLVLSPFVVSLFFFGLYKTELRPSLSCIDPSCIRDIWSLGMKFFVIQICSLIVFSTDNLIIVQLLGPEQVTNYTVVFKYYNILVVGFAMIAMPFWSAFTDAYAKNEFAWIRRMLMKQVKLLIPLCAIAAAMALAGHFVIEKVWLGRAVGISPLLLVLMAVYVVQQAWNRVFNWFLSGIGILNVTLFTMIAGAIVNIPISIFFVKELEMGSAGVILGTIISLSFFSVVGPMKAVSHLKQKVSENE